MKKIAFLASLLLCIGLTILSCSKDDGTDSPKETGPKITSFSPNSGPVGTNVFITGQNFGITAAANTVKIGNTTATVTSASATEIFITVPEGAVSGNISVTVGGKIDTAGKFTVTESTVDNSISLNKNTLDLFTLDSETLTPILTGTVTASDITWSSDDESVAIVDENGNVTGVAGGTTHITAYISDEVSTNCAVTVSPSVFAVGYEEINGIAVAKIWKNGVATELTDGTGFGAATSVFVDGTDVYTCGIVENGLPAAVIWKNGELLYELTDGTKYGNAYSVYVYDGDVYAIGNEELGDENISNATIWKNGATYATLTDGLNANETSSGEDIFVNETGIYSAGYEESAQHENGTPKLWEDSTQFNLTDETYHGRAYSLYAVGSDVYVAGYEENENGIEVAKYWKNGIVTDLSDGAQNAEAQSIFVKGEDVYVAGSYYEGQETLQHAVVWKNGTPTNVGSMGSGASSIYLYGEDVYVGGIELVGENSNAVVWKNGNPLELELTEDGGNSFVLSIFIR